MSALFLSHANEDRAKALELKRALAAAGYGDVFLSSDPEGGIAPGADWERALYQQLRRADAVVALCSPRSEASHWCFAEITQARALGKPVFPVLWETEQVPSPLAGVHATSLDGDLPAAVESLARGLRGSGVSTGGHLGRRAWTGLGRIAVLAAVPLAVLAAAVVVPLLRGDSRPAYVSAASLPVARLQLDGRDVGATPVAAYEVEPGTHELRLEHPRFHPYVRRFQVVSGSTFEVDRGLQALDPGDPEALKAVALAAGIELSTVEAVRAGGEPPALVVMFPRGVVRSAPHELALWGDGSAPAHEVKLERLTQTAPEPLWSAPVGRTVGRAVVALPPEIAARLGAGTRFRLRVLSARGTEISSALGSVLAPEEAAGLDRRLQRLGDAFPADDPLAEMLRIDVLLQGGLFGEAYERVQRLALSLGPRREVARLALVTLDRAGLSEQTEWDDWLTRFDEGR